jgi:hypothetical protein
MNDDYDCDEINTANELLSVLATLHANPKVPVVLVEVSGGLVTGVRLRNLDDVQVLEIDYDAWNEGAIPRDLSDQVESAAGAMIDAAPAA